METLATSPTHIFKDSMREQNFEEYGEMMGNGNRIKLDNEFSILKTLVASISPFKDEEEGKEKKKTFKNTEK